jgi:hypothetical protein
VAEVGPSATAPSSGLRSIPEREAVSRSLALGFRGRSCRAICSGHVPLLTSHRDSPTGRFPPARGVDRVQCREDQSIFKRSSHCPHATVGATSKSVIPVSPEPVEHISPRPLLAESQREGIGCGYHRGMRFRNPSKWLQVGAVVTGVGATIGVAAAVISVEGQGPIWTWPFISAVVIACIGIATLGIGVFAEDTAGAAAVSPITQNQTGGAKSTNYQAGRNLTIRGDNDQ